MKKYLIFLLTSLLCNTYISYAQDVTNKNIPKPTSPTAFQFLKYLEMPVSEYTGIPEIQIPLYTLIIDEVNIPINLNYHSAGNRVTQESSWIGLGWDLTFGSIIQQINDDDDIGYSQFQPNRQVTRKIPDYTMSGGQPTEYPTRYRYRCGQSYVDGDGWTATVPIAPVQLYHGNKIATDYFIPINGNYNQQEYELFTSDYIDTEPDIFFANFLGHNLKFIKKENPEKWIVLNKMGYRIEKIGISWKIWDPSGNLYLFDEKVKIESICNSYGALNNGTGNGNLRPSSNIWMLKKIITRNGREIIFSYTKTGKNKSFPFYSDKYFHMVNSNRICDRYKYQRLNAFTVNGTYDGIETSWGWQEEEYIYPSSIESGFDKVTFNLNDRVDIVGAKGLKILK